jgi:hypothetical protein
MRCVLYVSLAVVSSCAGSRAGLAPEAKNLREQALIVVRALATEDHQTVVEHSHPALLDAHGGPEHYAAELADRAAANRRSGITCDEPVEVYDPMILSGAGEMRYSLVAYRVTTQFPQHTAGMGPTDYLVAVSSDGGTTWQFLDRLGIGGDEKRLRALLPGVPDDFRLPSK